MFHLFPNQISFQYWNQHYFSIGFTFQYWSQHVSISVSIVWSVLVVLESALSEYISQPICQFSYYSKDYKKYVMSKQWTCMPSVIGCGLYNKRVILFIISVHQQITNTSVVPSVFFSFQCFINAVLCKSVAASLTLL